MDPKFLEADKIGIRLELVNGLPLWEAHPVVLHQLEIDRIRKSIKPPSKKHKRCDCIHVADIYVKFGSDSFKRPDISIFCRMPDEQEEAVTLIPEAVIEIVSKGYERKDLDIAPSFYLSKGVKDVIIFNPYTLRVIHAREEGFKTYESPVKLKLECGCVCTV
jgi:hypothetical protein